MNRTAFYLTIAALAGATALALRGLREASRENRELRQRYQRALAAGPPAPLVIHDTIIDTAARTATFAIRPVRTTGPLDGYVSKGLADTLATALGVASREIDRLTSKIVRIEARGKGERTADTVQRTQWITLKGDPVFDVRVNLANDSIYPAARLRLSQAYAPYRKNIFHRREYRSVIQASDPRVRITDVYDANRIPRSPRWSIGITAGPVFAPPGIAWGTAIGLTYDIVQF